MPSFFENPTLDFTPEQMERARKAQQARLNAALSTGPRTAEGKAISSKNALRHGFASSDPVILDLEDHAAWEAHLASYMDTFQPVNQPEADNIRRAALAMWKHDRLSQIEAKLFFLEFQYHTAKTDALLCEDMDKIERLAIAFKESAGDRAFDLCRRYIQSVSRQHETALRTFYMLESKRHPGRAATLQPPQKPAAQDPPEAIQNTGVQNEPTPRRPKTVPAPAIAAVKPGPAPSNTPKPVVVPLADPKNRRKLAS